MVTGDPMTDVDRILVTADCSKVEDTVIAKAPEVTTQTVGPQVAPRCETLGL